MSALPDLAINPAHDPALAELAEEMGEVKAEIDALFEEAKVRRDGRTDGWKGAGLVAWLAGCVLAGLLACLAGCCLDVYV